MILNHEKCQYICIDRNADQINFTFEDLCLTNSKKEKIIRHNY